MLNGSPDKTAKDLRPRDPDFQVIRSICYAAGLDICHPFSDDGQLAIIIGNTRYLWPHFLKRCDVTLDHPLDAYVESILSKATHEIKCDVAFSHQQPFIPIQKVAHDSGLAWLGATNLCIHPEYGPWFALRAVVKLQQDTNIENPKLVNPCNGCCTANDLERVINSPGDWRHWLALRESCSVGQKHRYCDEQILYHYTKDKSVLLNS